MKLVKKQISTFALILTMIATLIVCSFMTVGGSVYAEDVNDYSKKYYYNQLSSDPLAEKFYRAFETLVGSGEFAKGKFQFDLVTNGVATSEQVAEYVNGDNKLAKSYGAGRDCFYMDNPDLFYADVFSTSISAGQNTDGGYVAYLDTSRVLTTHMGNLDTQTKVENAISAYESKLTEITTEANKKATTQEKIEYVNNYIVENNNYGWGTIVVDGHNVDTDKAAYIYSSYGALINNESVCEGYAKAFKAVLDRLDIPCVLIQGYVRNNGAYQPHMWNAVQLDGHWYGVDVTNNSSFNNKYLLCGNQDMINDYIEDSVVSSAEYELKYPALKPYSYGNNTDNNGMEIVGSYTTDADEDKILSLSISYQNKGALKLEEEGMYLAYRFRQTKDEDEEEAEWGSWNNLVIVNRFAEEYYGSPVYEIRDDVSIIPTIGTNIACIQFALLNRLPNDLTYGTYSEVTNADFIMEPSQPYYNDGFQKFVIAPYIIKTTPSSTASWRQEDDYHIVLEYSENLALVDATGNVDIETIFQNGFEDAEEYYKIENVSWDGARSIEFDFSPSKMYKHNFMSYTFTPSNLVGAKSKLPCDPVSYTVRGKDVVCSKLCKGGRLFVKTFGVPKLLDTSDLSVTDFKDEKGNYYAESQRSQLMLVASKPSAEQEHVMDDVLKDKTGIKDDEIMASSTYELDLQICKDFKKIPNDSHVQVSFGFPDGYSPNDTGTTFKIYHYKRDNSGNIVDVEEIPLIITEYGLIAKVDGFSPFRIVQIKNTSVAVANSQAVNIYASVNGEYGGKITTNGKSGICEVTGDNITYDIVADNGYTIASVILNGKTIDATNYANGTLTLSKSELNANNTLEVRFVNQQIANAYEENGLAIKYDIPLYSEIKIKANEDNVADANNDVATKIIIAIIVAVVIATIAGSVCLCISKRKINKQLQ